MAPGAMDFRPMAPGAMDLRVDMILRRKFMGKGRVVMVEVFVGGLVLRYGNGRAF